MKRKILTLIMLSSAILAMAQPPVDNLSKLNSNPQKIKPGILTDKTDINGKRVIYGKAQFINLLPDEDAETILMGKPIATSITTQAYQKGETLGITLNMVRMKKRSVPDNARVLIKTQQGTTLETLVLEGCQAEQTYQPVVNIAMMTRPYEQPRYTMHCHIILSQEHIDLITSEGIAKMRIQTDQDYYDIELKKDNISQFYVQELAMIREAATKKGGSFTDGF